MVSLGSTADSLMSVKPNPLRGPITPFPCLTCAFSPPEGRWFMRVFPKLKSFSTVQKDCSGEG